jgi:hypothetical protein
MAASKGAVASGADLDQTTRRRNVQASTPSSGAANQVEVDDKKTQSKKVRLCAILEAHSPCTINGMGTKLMCFVADHTVAPLEVPG